MKKGFLEKNSAQSDEKTTLFKVLSRREDLFLRVDNSLLPKLDDDAKLKKMLDTLFRKSSKANRREIINITQHNYRIFL